MLRGRVERQTVSTARCPLDMEQVKMLIMYRDYQLVPVKSNESWQVQIFLGGKLITTTMILATEDSAMAEARKDVDGFRSGRG